MSPTILSRVRIPILGARSDGITLTPKSALRTTILIASLAIDGGLARRERIALIETRTSHDRQTTACRLACPEPRRLRESTDPLKVPALPTLVVVRATRIPTQATGGLPKAIRRTPIVGVPAIPTPSLAPPRTTSTSSPTAPSSTH